jgi:hypothetical protein
VKSKQEIDMKSVFFILAIISATLAPTAFAGEETKKHEHPPVTMPGQFETLKQLVGTWEGKSDMGQGEQTMQVVYELTSGGTAIIETLMPGTPHEMVSVYHKDGNSLAMTHYCALGNQPHMKLKQADARHLSFEMDQQQGLASADEAHMHGLTLTLKDKNTLQQDWTHYEGGKSTQTVTFVLNKKT